MNNKQSHTLAPQRAPTDRPTDAARRHCGRSPNMLSKSVRRTESVWVRVCPFDGAGGGSCSRGPYDLIECACAWRRRRQQAKCVAASAMHMHKRNYARTLAHLRWCDCRENEGKLRSRRLRYRTAKLLYAHLCCILYCTYNIRLCKVICLHRWRVAFRIITQSMRCLIANIRIESSPSTRSTLRALMKKYVVFAPATI